uniref:UBC core domain-containing protein n=1 Tax=Anopheles maculatus TaxID=74869 RepID=A0A182SYF5_9DIPT
MASGDDQWLKEDGYLNVDAESRLITYHPYLNVIIVIGSNSEVKLLDVNSGVILQTYRISDNNAVRCRYLPQQDKILIWNGRNICMRGDYNGVLLLDTILQAPVTSTDDRVRLELLLTEAHLFLQCLQNLEEHGLENMSDVTNELTQKISEAQSHSKRGIKAQKWETVCLELPHSSLRMVASGVVMQLRRLDQHIPAMAIASAINERLTDLLRGARVNESAKSVQRFQMYSEAARRQTFEAWPHMDYKWVLPDQMAQAGFYHQPGENGNKDRAMCFTCTVCLVCWEKTDEPWSEHERHSPECPFVKGEFTQNVPLSVTYATSPAIATAGFSLISSGDRGVVFCTGNPTGDVTVWNIERQLTKVHEFQVKLHPDILTTTTISPTATVDSLELNALAAYFVRSPACGNALQQRRASLSLKPKMLGTKIVAGVRVQSTEPIDREYMYDVYVPEPETTLLLIVYNIEDPAMEDASPPGASPTLTATPQATQLQLNAAGVGGNAMKSNLFTIMESTEDESVKLLAERQNVLLSKLQQANQKLAMQKTAKLKKKHTVVDVSENDSGKIKSVSAVDSSVASSTTLPSTSMNIVTDALATGITVSVPGIGVGGSEGGGGGTGDSGGGEGDGDGGVGGGGGGGGGESASAMDAIFCIPLQYIELPPIMIDSGARYYISDTVPSSDNRHLLVVVKYDDSNSAENTNQATTNSSASSATDVPKDDEQKEDNNEYVTGPLWYGVLLLYKLNEDGLVRADDPLMLWLSQEQVPLEITMLPKCDGTGRHFGGPETDQGIFVMTSADGRLRIVSLKTFAVISEASVKDDRFVSATYCKSLERLCGCTAKGCLHFYSFYDLDADSSDERDEEIVVQTSLASTIDSGDKAYGGTTGVDGAAAIDVIDNRSTVQPSVPTVGVSNSDGASGTTPQQQQQQQAQHHPEGMGQECWLAFRPDVGSNVNNLKMLHTLTLFSELLTPYSAEVPACWNELEQAQKQRRNPQHLRPGDDTHLTKTWRLHNDASTWDEHLIELNLPKCTSLGHIDFKFSLYQPCANSPAIQVTLLKQKSMGLCTRRKPQSINRVDESINFNIGAGEGKLLSEEYLQARNAEIVVGPIELASCMDLSEQGGCVTLTSPKLLKSKGRNYLLHIKTMTDLSKDGQGKTRAS